MKKLFLLIAIILVVACEHERDENYYGASPSYPCGMSSPNPTYVEAKRIINQYCVTCHNVDSIGRYHQYDQINNACLNGTFNRRVFIKRDMPPANACQMDSCDYVILRRWFINGHQPF